MREYIFSLTLVIFAFGCGEIPESQDETAPTAPNLSVTSVEPGDPTCQCPVNMTLPNGTDLANIMEMRDGVLHLKVPVSIEVAPEATALTLRGGRFGLDAEAYEIGVRGSGATGLRGDGSSYGVYGSTTGGYGVYGTDSANGNGVYGYSNTGAGIAGVSSTGDAVSGNAWGNGNALYGWASGSGNGVFASSVSGYGVHGIGTKGVYGTSSSGNGVYGNTTATDTPAIEGHATSGAGLAGYSNSGYGLFGSSVNTFGAYANSTYGSAIYGHGATYGFYTTDAVYVGKDAVAPVARQGESAGWISCPETGECACPAGQYVAKTADRGAQIFCAAF